MRAKVARIVSPMTCQPVRPCSIGHVGGQRQRPHVRGFVKVPWAAVKQVAQRLCARSIKAAHTLHHARNQSNPTEIALRRGLLTNHEIAVLVEGTAAAAAAAALDRLLSSRLAILR
jgi:hypothetical protein